MIDRILKALAVLCVGLVGASAAHQLPAVVGTIAGIIGPVIGILANSPIAAAVAPKGQP